MDGTARRLTIANCTEYIPIDGITSRTMLIIGNINNVECRHIYKHQQAVTCEYFKVLLNTN